MIIQEDLPPSVGCTAWGHDFYHRIKYYVKAQVNTVDRQMVVDEKGKSMLRCKQLITISHPKFIPVMPDYSRVMYIEKKVGFKARLCNVSLQFSNFIFYPGDQFHFVVQSVDNTQNDDPCELVVEHVTEA